ncbi:hypothetical protein PR048_016286 [Dryococelus australis]|uniref:Uncharacterized protein n=1 Tax=Dryococelus australis TaxID=614101 RepID=A0ABQ9HJC0_9NEOP|nr:hypothetical protein PR048_016286 [Dryococelus australis]
MQAKQSAKQLADTQSRHFVEGELVWVRSVRAGKINWLPGQIHHRLRTKFMSKVGGVSVMPTTSGNGTPCLHMRVVRNRRPRQSND